MRQADAQALLVVTKYGDTTQATDPTQANHTKKVYSNWQPLTITKWIRATQVRRVTLQRRPARSSTTSTRSWPSMAVLSPAGAHPRAARPRAAPAAVHPPGPAPAAPGSDAPAPASDHQRSNRCDCAGEREAGDRGAPRADLQLLEHLRHRCAAAASCGALRHFLPPRRARLSGRHAAGG